MIKPEKNVRKLTMNSAGPKKTTTSLISMFTSMSNVRIIVVVSYLIILSKLFKKSFAPSIYLCRTCKIANINWNILICKNQYVTDILLEYY